MAVVTDESQYKASEPCAFGEDPDEKVKTHRMLQPVICMLETAVGSRTLRKTLEKISQQS
jgi:hypothetical protein